ncbi:MAG: contractile injection system tape measure protein [Burkholderiales bacterium]
MNSQHVIDECRVELVFQEERAALDGQVYWEALVKGRLLAVTEEVFDEMSLPGEICRLDNLCIDLGSADPVNGGAEIERRMREQLRAALGKVLHSEPIRADEAGRTLTRAMSDFEQITHFLRFGRLPWHGRRGGNGGFDALVRSVLESKVKELASWLRETTVAPSVLQRLTRQFPQDTLDLVCASLAPGRAAFFGALARLLLETFAAAGSSFSADSRVNRLVWEALIGTALERGQTKWDATEVAREAILRFARVHGKSSGAMLASLRDAIARLRGMHEPALDVGGAFSALQRVVSWRAPALPLSFSRIHEFRNADREPGIKLPDAWKWKQMIIALERSVVLGDASAVRGMWHTLVREHAALVTRVVRQRGTLAKVRRRMAEELPEVMLRDIVWLLEPAHGEFVTELVQRPELFRAEVLHPAPPPEALRRRLWEFTLTYLLVERGSRFNKETYVGSVVAQMAARDNLDYSLLLGGLIGVLERAETGDPLQGQMLELLRDLLRSAPARDQGPDPVESGASLARGLIVYDEILARLNRGTASGTRNDLIIADIRELAQYAPGQFTRFVRELEGHSPLARRLVERVSPDTLRKIIFAVMNFPHASEGLALSTFGDSLDRFVARVREPRRYLAEVLEYLLRGEDVDLEAIALSLEENFALQPSPDPDTGIASTVASDRDTGEGEVAESPARLARRRLRILLDDWIAGGRIEPVATVWRELTQRQPTLFRGLLRGRAHPDQAARVIAQSATEPMLRDIVRVLEPEHAGFIERIVDRPELFREGAESGLSNTESVKHRLWEFTLSYLFTERGGRFNKRAYMGSLVRRMAARYNLAAGELANALIGLLEAVPAPDPLQLEMLASLRWAAPQPSPGPEKGIASRVTSDQGTREGEVAEAPARVARRRFRVLLDDWIAGGGIEPLAPVWRELTQGQPALLRALLRDRSHPDQAARVIAASATEPMLRDIVRVLEPEHAGFIERIVDRPDLFKQGMVNGMSNPEGVKHRLWEFTLSYLFTERGGQFNKRAYMGSLVQRMAARHNLAAGALANALIGMLEAVPAPDALQLEMLTSLRFAAAQWQDTQRPQGNAVLAEIVASLGSPGALSAKRRSRLAQVLVQQLSESPRALRDQFKKILQDRRAIRRLVDLLPEHLLLRLLSLLAPSDYARVFQCADLVSTAFFMVLKQPPATAKDAPGRRSDAVPSKPRSRASAEDKRQSVHSGKWRFIFNYLVAEGRRFDLDRFTRLLLCELGARFNVSYNGAWRKGLREQLIRAATPVDRALVERIAAALGTLGDSRDKADRGVKTEARRAPVRREEPPVEALESIQVLNAGQVLAAPYMPRLFEMLQLTEHGKFKDEGATHRALHVLQFMVDGSTQTSEDQLVLNKILCGVPLATPVERDVYLSDAEKQAVDGLIQGMIQNWTILGNTSVGGFRESFLQREGRLQRKDDTWRLRVEPRTFDMLLDRIPWGYSTIKHSWMERVVHVDWR